MTGRLGLALGIALLAAGCRKAPKESPLESARLEALAAERFDERRLVAALERILAWHRRNDPAAAELRPGLSDAEIDRLTQGLPFRLPEELRVLYRWRDGGRPGAPFVWYHEFPSLEEALALRRSRRWRPWWGSSWLPVFDFQDESFFVDCGAAPAAAKPVRFFFLEETEHWVSYLNLTTMMLTLAEGVEAGAVSMKAGAPDWDAERLKPIHDRLNPGAAFPYAVRPRR